MLRYRNGVVHQVVRLKNRIAGLLMEDGQVYDARRLHGKRYFYALLERLQTPASILQLLRLSRGTLELFQAGERRLIHQLHNDSRLHTRVQLLMSIRGVGEVLALTWALEIAEVQRFSSIRKACSYCGLTSAQHLQTVLIEAAKLAPRWNPELAALHQRELARGNRHRATLAVAHTLVAYLVAVDRSGQPFQPRSAAISAAAAGPAGPVLAYACLCDGGRLQMQPSSCFEAGGFAQT